MGGKEGSGDEWVGKGSALIVVVMVMGVVLWCGGVVVLCGGAVIT